MSKSEKANALRLKLNEIDRDKYYVTVEQIIKNGTDEEIDFFYNKLCEERTNNVH